LTTIPFRRTALALLLCTPLAAAQAAVFTEVEPNNTLATAQLISDPGSVQTVISGQRAFNDASDDFFRFNVAANSSLQIVSTSSSMLADSIMGLYNAAGTLVASNDDAAPGNSMSAISFQVGAGLGGLFTLGLSGFNPGLLACTVGVTSCYDTNNDFLFDTLRRRRWRRGKHRLVLQHHHQPGRCSDPGAGDLRADAGRPGRARFRRASAQEQAALTVPAPCSPGLGRTTCRAFSRLDVDTARASARLS
jgi:hypothetical protein